MKNLKSRKQTLSCNSEKNYNTYLAAASCHSALLDVAVGRRMLMPPPVTVELRRSGFLLFESGLGDPNPIQPIPNTLTVPNSAYPLSGYVGQSHIPMSHSSQQIHTDQIAVEGCMHGELDNVYSTLKYLEEVENTKVDLLICCGDFQAVRNKNDLDSVNVKAKYRNMNSFWKYYTGQVIAPVPTVFIGGNHEASNYLWELYYGGWAAPNIYFLGFAGVIKFGGIRLAGLSGIYKEYRHFERAPYNEKEIRSIYHVREYDVYKLMQIEEPIDIFISHDWPRGITKYGDWEKLISQKPFFKEEVISHLLAFQLLFP
ncbi:Lariat debranching enzyme [Nymphaea thermarum]|nr:Lariat debranching enzyme [Nymphaea thermarum]